MEEREKSYDALAGLLHFPSILGDLRDTSGNCSTKETSIMKNVSAINK